MSAAIFSIPNVRCVDRSPKAIAVLIHPNATRLSWVPFKMLAPESEVRRTNDRGTLVVSAWWADVSRTRAYYEELTAGNGNAPERKPGRPEDETGFRNAISEYHRG